MKRGTLILAIVAFVSLAGNMFLAGLVIGRGFWAPLPVDGPGRAGLGREMEFTLRSLSRGLDEETRHKLRQEVRKRRADLRPVMAEITDVLRSLRRQMGEEEVDKAAVTASFARLRVLHSELQAPLQALIVDVAAELPPDKRRALMEQADRRRHRFKRGSSSRD